MQTDASGDDGFGGFGLRASLPGTIYVLSERWPPDVLAALARAAMPRAERERTPPAPSLAMPSAELFGTWATAEATAAAAAPRPPRVERVIAVGDCMPVAAVLSSASAHAPQLRQLLAHMRRFAPWWLGAHVLRQFNTDADALSHPERIDSVIRAAEAAGLTVQRVSTRGLTHLWDALRESMQEAMRAEEAQRAARGR